MWTSLSLNFVILYVDVAESQFCGTNRCKVTRLSLPKFNFPRFNFLSTTSFTHPLLVPLIVPSLFYLLTRLKGSFWILAGAAALQGPKGSLSKSPLNTVKSLSFTVLLTDLAFLVF